MVELYSKDINNGNESECLILRPLMLKPILNGLLNLGKRRQLVTKVPDCLKYPLWVKIEISVLSSVVLGHSMGNGVEGNYVCKTLFDCRVQVVFGPMDHTDKSRWRRFYSEQTTGEFGRRRSCLRGLSSRQRS